MATRFGGHRVSPDPAFLVEGQRQSCVPCRPSDSGRFEVAGAGAAGHSAIARRYNAASGRAGLVCMRSGTSASGRFEVEGAGLPVAWPLPGGTMRRAARATWP